MDRGCQEGFLFFIFKVYVSRSRIQGEPRNVVGGCWIKEAGAEVGGGGEEKETGRGRGRISVEK